MNGKKVDVRTGILIVWNVLKKSAWMIQNMNVIKMWLLIECDGLMDAGKNEKQRIIVSGKLLEIKENRIGEVIFTGQGTQFHPCTPKRD